MRLCTHYLELGLVCISQLLSFGESCIGFSGPFKCFESNAFVVPGGGIVGIKPDGLGRSLDRPPTRRALGLRGAEDPGQAKKS